MPALEGKACTRAQTHTHTSTVNEKVRKLLKYIICDQENYIYDDS